ncbi:hypothetical protein ABEF93_000707 [Exophiala dermatitidis]
MQIAAFLSDLKSLSICSHEAAVSLVKPARSTSVDSKETASDNHEASPPGASAEPQQSLDPDLQYANELVSLHYDVKVNYLQRGADPDLIQAEKNVEQVLSALNRSE